jgi:glutathione S-transferase
MQPLQNLTVLRQVKEAEITPEPGAEPKTVDARGFATDKMVKGLVALEQIVSKLSPPSDGQRLFAAGSPQPSIADFCIVPQLYNCRRFNIDLSPYPSLLAVEQRCRDLPAFQAADPAAQPDAQTA